MESAEPQPQPQAQPQQQLLLPFAYSSSSSSSSSSGGSPARLSPDTAAPPTTTSASAGVGSAVCGQSASAPAAAGGSATGGERRRQTHSSGGGSGGTATGCSSCTSRLTLFTSHQVAHQIIRETSERHQKGIMHPWIYQVLVEVSNETCHIYRIELLSDKNDTRMYAHFVRLLKRVQHLINCETNCLFLIIRFSNISHMPLLKFQANWLYHLKKCTSDLRLPSKYEDGPQLITSISYIWLILMMNWQWVLMLTLTSHYSPNLNFLLPIYVTLILRSCETCAVLWYRCSMTISYNGWSCQMFLVKVTSYSCCSVSCPCHTLCSFVSFHRFPRQYRIGIESNCLVIMFSCYSCFANARNSNSSVSTECIQIQFMVTFFRWPEYCSRVLCLYFSTRWTTRDSNVRVEMSRGVYISSLLYLVKDIRWRWSVAAPELKSNCKRSILRKDIVWTTTFVVKYPL